MKLHPLCGEDALEPVRNFEVETHSDAREKLKNCDFGAEPAPDRAELEADRAGADDEQFCRRSFKRERLRTADDNVAIEWHAWEVDRHAAGRDDDMISGDFGRFAVVRPNAQFARCGDRSETSEGCDLVDL